MFLETPTRPATKTGKGGTRGLVAGGWERLKGIERGPVEEWWSKKWSRVTLWAQQERGVKRSVEILGLG